MKIVDGFVWKVVTDQAKEIFQSELFPLYKLYEDGSEALIEEFDDLQIALEQGMDIGIEIGQINPEQAKKFLKHKGYFTDNLWSVVDVQSKFKCTDEEAQNVLKNSLKNDATMEQIWYSIGEFGELEKLKPVKNEE